MSSPPPSILIAAAKWWPLSARLAMALVRQGCRVSALCPHGHPLTRVGGLERIERYRGIRSLASLERSVRELQPDIVVPADDGVVAQLQALHASAPSLKALLERSLGDAQSFPITSNRFRLLDLAAKLGILVPETRRVASCDDLVSWHRRVAPAAVLKIDGECGGNGVRICQSPEESLAAFRELLRSPGLATAWKRLLVNRDPLALWAHRARRPIEVTVQQLIRGRPANTMLACREGELLAQVSVAVLATEGPTGAATVVRRIDSKPMELAARRLAERLKLSGFYGLDFIIEAESQNPYLIEMNPRCTQLGHLKFGEQPSLAGAFAASLCAECGGATEEPLPLDTVALFPQALNSIQARQGVGASSRSYLDVPWDEPLLIAELKQISWPERRWAARLYHAWKPVAPAVCIEHADLESPAAPLASPVRLVKP